MRQPMMLALAVILFSSPLAAQGSPPQGGANQPYTMEYYYKTQWGHQQEFLQLFLKNHYPLLQKEVEQGRILSVKIETPANHMTEESRWDYRVTITFRNSTMATTSLTFWTRARNRASLRNSWASASLRSLISRQLTTMPSISGSWLRSRARTSNHR